ncbi:MAG: (2Fe-2S) ferredoxin domain-containing protein [Myxococcales bacterium]|nr:(2Fe-2S) ferredoxin domain-containing protein [Myxococcales bacterium]
MKVALLRPVAHVHVCTHRRSAADPLGPGCGARGEAVFEALGKERTHRRLVRDVWLARSSCLGQCPATGCTVAIGPLHLVEVEPGDAGEVLDEASAAR